MKAQYQFWSVLGPGPDALGGSLFYFRVVKADMLRLPMSLQQTATGKTKFMFQLNLVWALRIFDQRVLGVSAAEMASWARFNGGKVPELVLRLPKPVAFLVATRQWTHAAVPHGIPSANLQAGWEGATSGGIFQQLWALRNSFEGLPTSVHLTKLFGGGLVPVDAVNRPQNKAEFVHQALQTSSCALLQHVPGQGGMRGILEQLRPGFAGTGSGEACFLA